MKDKYLPIGSIVLLNGGSKKLMIIGYYVTNTLDGITYDYSACIYPEGIIDNKNTLLLNHRDIMEIVFVGYSDNEEQKHKAALNILVDEEKSNNDLFTVTKTQINLETLFD